jgi:hypothetical protein
MAMHKITVEVHENTRAQRLASKIAHPKDRSFAARFRAVASFGPAEVAAGAASPLVAATRAVRELLSHLYRE